MQQRSDDEIFQAKTTLFGIGALLILALSMLAAAVYKSDWHLFSFGAGLTLFAFIGMLTLTKINK